MPTPHRCDPKLFEKDLKGQVVIVTGANSGCGLETSRQLVKQGATVILACRSKEKGEIAAKDVGGVFLTTMDLSSLESVRKFVDAFKENYDRLDVLVTNAGVMACPFAKTLEGFEYQMGCNHLAHFLLQQSLADLMLETSVQTAKPSRFVALSSCAAGFSTLADQPADIDFTDLNWESRDYDEGSAYRSSKLANYFHAFHAGTKMYSSDQLLCTSVHPGWVRSPLDVHVFRKMFGDTWWGRIAAETVRSIFALKGDMISPEDGAQTSLHCILEDADKIQSGAFYSQFGIYRDPEAKKGGWPMKLPNDNATPEKAEQLWNVSLDLVGLK